ncbi:MAG: hypothetical protein OXF41_11625, partial [bacterium]|nr:hypothetical protein [bacterium]
RAGRDGTGGDGRGRDGAGRDGRGRDGTGRDGTGRAGTGRDGTIETLVVPGQKLISHTPLLQYIPPYEEPGLGGC